MKTTNIITLATALAVLGGCRGGEAGAGIASGTDGNDESGSTSNVDPTEDPTQSSSGVVDTDSSGGVDPTVGGDYDPVLLDCPAPGSLPFQLESSGVQDSANEQLLADNPRVKDQASDILGNPGGLLAYTSIDVSADPGDDEDLFEGAKARTVSEEGLGGVPIIGEFVSLWRYDGSEWTSVARGKTDDFGAYSFDDIELSDNNLQPLYSVLEADGTCTPHYTFLFDPGTQVIITDIDGTMTLSDEELFTQIQDGNYDPLENGSAAEMMRLWNDKGFTVVYLTARPHQFRTETRVWLRDHNFPTGPLISSNTLVINDAARTYKRTWGRRLTEDFGWEIVAAYGNATSDIEAYEDAGIPKDITFIIGENAGVADTVPILDNDYSAHIVDFVEPHPDAN